MPSNVPLAAAVTANDDDDDEDDDTTTDTRLAEHFTELFTLSLEALLEHDPVLPMPVLRGRYGDAFGRDFAADDVNSVSGDSNTSQTSYTMLISSV